MPPASPPPDPRLRRYLFLFVIKFASCTMHSWFIRNSCIQLFKLASRTLALAFVYIIVLPEPKTAKEKMVIDVEMYVFRIKTPHDLDFCAGGAGRGRGHEDEPQKENDAPFLIKCKLKETRKGTFVPYDSPCI